MGQRFGRILFNAFCIIAYLLVIGCIVWLFCTSSGYINRFYLFYFFCCAQFGLVVLFVAHTIGALHFSGLLDRHKPAKFSVEEEVEYMVGCVRRAEEVLNSKESNRLGFHNKRLMEIISMAEEKGHQKKYKKLRPKLATIEYEAKECKKRIEEKIKKELKN